MENQQNRRKTQRIQQPFNIKVRDVFITPEEAFAAMDKVFGVNLRNAYDPCPYPAPNFNGLLIDWMPVTFCNPPFSQAADWVIKAIQQAKRGVTTYMILPWYVFYQNN